MFVRVRVYTCVYMCVCVCRLRERAHARARARARDRLCVYTSARARVCESMRARVFASRRCVHACIRYASQMMDMRAEIAALNALVDSHVPALATSRN